MHRIFHKISYYLHSFSTIVKLKSTFTAHAGIDNFNSVYYNYFKYLMTSMYHMRKRCNMPRYYNRALRYISAGLLSISLLLLIISPVFGVSIVSSSLPDGRVGTAYNYTLVADGTPPYTWAPLGTLPPGLTLNANGTISGTPTTVGTYTFQVQVTGSDPAPDVDDRYFTINITQPPLVFSTTTLPQATEGTSYYRTFSASGGTTPYSWSLTGGTLPKGISLEYSSSYCYLTGTPAAGTAGSHTFSITVTDSSSPVQSVQQSFTLYIEEGSYNLTVTIGTGLASGKTKVYLNGVQLTSLSGGESKNYNAALGSSGTVSVDATIVDPDDDGIRYRVKDNEVVVSESQPTAAFSYYSEYRVRIATSPSGVLDVSADQWLKEDDTFSFNATEEVEGETGILYRFSHWVMPNGSEIETENVTFDVDEPATVTAYYDTYYLLSIDSLYGEVEGGGWYKANTAARWTVVDDTVPMTGLLGLFGAKYRAVNDTDTEIMDSPKAVTVFWEPDYTMALIFIPLVVLAIIGIIVGLYIVAQRSRPKPAPYPGPAMAGMPPPRPIGPRPIPHHTTVVMVQGEQQKKELPASSTKEQLMAKFGELLEIYEKEIQSNISEKGLPQAKAAAPERGIPAPKPIPPSPALGKGVDDEEEEEPEEERVCGYSTKRLLRTVTGPWRQTESEAVTLPEKDRQGGTSKTGLSVVWSRDIYQEWEVLTCTLPKKHKGSHRGETEIIYTLLNTIDEKKTYSSRQKLKPPSPHFTDGMPELDLDEDQIISADELPEETVK